jgi:uncharacterized protein (TIGR02285 family)
MHMAIEACRKHWKAYWWGALSMVPLCALFVSPGAQAAQTDQPVTLHYIQRPPYMMVAGEGLAGLTGAPSYLVFKAAKVPVVIQETPFARQLHYLEINSGQDCMIGMFKKPERERFAKYSKPMYQDQPQMILTNAANAPRFAAHSSVVDVFNDKGLTLLVKLGYSYGAPLDAFIEKYQPTRQSTTDENLAMIRLIKLGVADYMLMAPEEAAVAIEAAGFTPRDFKQIKFKNMPGGEYRHLLCSRSVPDEVMQKLNAAIRFKK